jgi:hypothetical protein
MMFVGPSPIQVTWVDAQSDAEQWLAHDELERTPRVIHTIGYDLGPVMARHVTVAASYDTHTQNVGQVMHIPEECVIDRRDLIAVRNEGNT